MAADVTGDIAALLTRELEGFQRELRLFPDEDSAWRTLPGVGNSAANLALHVAGNIQHFIGAVLGGTAYVRDRHREFGARSASRTEILAELSTSLEVVRTVLPRVTPEQLEAEFTAHPTATRISTRRFLIHLCTHASFHLGQVGYLRRIVTGDARSTDTVTATRL